MAELQLDSVSSKLSYEKTFSQHGVIINHLNHHLNSCLVSNCTSVERTITLLDFW